MKVEKERKRRGYLRVLELGFKNRKDDEGILRREEREYGRGVRTAMREAIVDAGKSLEVEGEDWVFQWEGRV